MSKTQLIFFKYYCSTLYDVEKLDELRKMAFESGMSINDIETASKEHLCRFIASSLIYAPIVKIPENSNPKDALNWLCMSVHDDYYVEEVRKWAVKAGYKNMRTMSKKQICDMVIPDRVIKVPSYSEWEGKEKDAYVKKYEFPIKKRKTIEMIEHDERVAKYFPNNDTPLYDTPLYDQYKKKIKKAKSLDEVNNLESEYKREKNLQNTRKEKISRIESYRTYSCKDECNQIRKDFINKVNNAKSDIEIDYIFDEFKKAVDKKIDDDWK